MRITVIDSGVHASHPHVQRVAGGIAIDSSGGIHSDYIDRLGHGTAVTAAIREKAPAADIFVIKVFDRELRTTGDALVAALRVARDNHTQIVNLSLGTTNPEYETRFAAEIRAAQTCGMFVVAAAPQPEARWLPGTLPDTIAVELDMSLPRERCDIVMTPDNQIRARASGYPRPIPGVPPGRNLHGISFAVANVTGLLALVLEGVAPGTDLRAALGSVKSTSLSG